MGPEVFFADDVQFHAGEGVDHVGPGGSENVDGGAHIVVQNAGRCRKCRNGSCRRERGDGAADRVDCWAAAALEFLDRPAAAARRGLEPRKRVRRARVADAHHQRDFFVAVGVGVGAVQIDAMLPSERLDRVRFALAPHRRARRVAGEASVFDFEARAEHVVDAQELRRRFDLIGGRGRSQDQRVALLAVRFYAALHFGVDAIGDLGLEQLFALSHQLAFVAALPVLRRERDQVVEARPAEHAAGGKRGEAQPFARAHLAAHDTHLCDVEGRVTGDQRAVVVEDGGDRLARRALLDFFDGAGACGCLARRTRRALGRDGRLGLDVFGCLLHVQNHPRPAFSFELTPGAFLGQKAFGTIGKSGERSANDLAGSGVQTRGNGR